MHNDGTFLQPLWKREHDGGKWKYTSKENSNPWNFIKENDGAAWNKGAFLMDLAKLWDTFFFFLYLIEENDGAAWNKGAFLMDLAELWDSITTFASEKE